MRDKLQRESSLLAGVTGVLNARFTKIKFLSLKPRKRHRYKSNHRWRDHIEKVKSLTVFLSANKFVNSSGYGSGKFCRHFKKGIMIHAI